MEGHLGSLGSIWDGFGNHLGIIWTAIWESFGGLEAEEASGRQLEVRSQKLMPLSARMPKLY